MTGPFAIFRRSSLWTDCEECRLRVNLSKAGACSRCRRILCYTHLHGSFARQLIVDIGFAQPVCKACRGRSPG